jgi:hypothetical protein
MLRRNMLCLHEQALVLARHRDRMPLAQDYHPAALDVQLL